MARRRIDRTAVTVSIVTGRRTGLTLARACAAVGVHVATVCRWQAADPEFRSALRDAARAFAVGKYANLPHARPGVRWRNECPACRAKLVVRTTSGGIRFWRCGLWPRCRWASWRPRHPRNCPTCGGPRFWSHSRKSVACDRCRMRIPAH